MFDEFDQFDQFDQFDMATGRPTEHTTERERSRPVRRRRAPLLVALAALVVGGLAAEASAQVRGRSPREGGYGYAGGPRYYEAGGTYATRNRLYRHRSGYLYGQSRAYQYRGRGYFYGGYYGGYSGGPGGGGGCGIAAYEIADFDARRDRLLHEATQIDVGYLGNTPLGVPIGTPAPRPREESAEWTNLAAGEAVRALGGFTARLFSNPSDIEARIGFGIAAGLIGDDARALESFRMAVRIDPDALCDFEADGAIVGRIREVLARFEAPETPGARFTASALHCLLGEDEAAALALASDGGGAERSQVASTLREVLAKAQPPATEAPVEATVEEGVVNDESAEELVASRDGTP